MKVLIEIDEEDYKYFSSLSDREKVNNLTYYEKIIANAIPFNDVTGEIIKELDKALYEHFHEKDSPLNTTEVRLGAVRNFIKNFQLVKSDRYR